MKRRTRCLIGLCLAIIALPYLMLLFLFSHGPESDRGGAVISFISELSEDVRIVAYDFGDRRLSEEAGITYTARGPSARGTPPGAIMAASEGRQEAVIHYRIGREEETRIFRFAVDLVAQNSCDVVVTFRQQGPHASACTNHMPAYGGVWLH